MKKIPVFLLLVLFVPFISEAQDTSISSTTSATATSTTDGSTEAPLVRTERIRGWRHQSSEIQQKINTLPTAAVNSVPMPVLFGVGVKDISPNFGDPRDGGTRTHEGEDIMAVKGTPIVSPTPAIVLRTGVGATEGNYVYTANPGGETFVYMHLDRIGEGVSAGTVLATGSLIGYVGNTGNAAGGPAHLHFEIHNSSGTPTDPFPRLTAEFSAQEKITDLSTILTQTSDSVALSQFLVTNFRSTFVTDTSLNISLPTLITDALASIPVSTVVSASARALPSGDLDSGSAGDMVVALQNYLIRASVGPAAVRLAVAGATGSFGPLTKAALIEYQASVHISPASGYYGPLTRTYIASHPIEISQTGTTNTTTTVATSTSVALTRDLYKGKSGEDVRTLQKILNTDGFTVATTGFGSPGEESDYFGPATQAAVIKFQIAHAITPAVGYVGPITRALIASVQ